MVQSLSWFFLLLAGFAEAQTGTAPLPAVTADEIVAPWADAVGGEKPRESARQFRFAAGSNALKIPIVEDNGHIFVQGTVDGFGPVWMTLDTGAGGAIVDKALVKNFGIKPTGTLQAEGAGGVETEETATNVSFGLPGLSLHRQSTGVLPLDFISRRTGRSVAALLGYEFFANFAVEIDFAGERMNLYDPRTFHYSGRGEIVPLEFHDNLPYIDASLKMPDGEVATGKFVVDLGSDISVIVPQNYAAKHNLLKSLHPTMEVTARGVGGGEVRTVNARIAGIQIQQTFVAGPIAAFPQNSQGFVAGENSVGNMGGSLLRHFHVIFDYSRQQMILEQGADFAEPFDADASGLRVIASGPKLETVSIAAVVAGSPAVEAGLQIGDQLMALDGRPVPEIRMLKKIFRQDGRELELTVKRAGTVEVRKLRLRKDFMSCLPPLSQAECLCAEKRAVPLPALESVYSWLTSSQFRYITIQGSRSMEEGRGGPR